MQNLIANLFLKLKVVWGTMINVQCDINVQEGYFACNLNSSWEVFTFCPSVRLSLYGYTHTHTPLQFSRNLMEHNFIWLRCWHDLKFVVLNISVGYFECEHSVVSAVI
jgi:hypothetical protein